MTKDYYYHSTSEDDVRCTVCGIFDERTKNMAFGVARCSHNDQYNKKIGRTLAKARALTEPVVTVQFSRNLAKELPIGFYFRHHAGLVAITAKYYPEVVHNKFKENAHPSQSK